MNVLGKFPIFTETFSNSFRYLRKLYILLVWCSGLEMDAWQILIICGARGVRSLQAGDAVVEKSPK